MRIILRKTLLILVTFFMLFLSSCSSKTPVILEDRYDVGLNELVRIGFKNSNSKDMIDNVVVTLDDQEVRISYNTIDNNIVEFQGLEIFKPKKTYHLEIILESEKIFMLDFFTVSQFTQDVNDLKKKFFIMPVIEDYDLNEADIMKERILGVSPLILVSLYRAGVKMKLVNGPITVEPELEYLRGITPRGWEGSGLTWDDVPGAGGYDLPVARIGCSDPTFENNHGSINLELHEFAHTVDNYITGAWDGESLSFSEEFIEIWNEEVEGVLSDDYFVNYNEEYFAETFAMYYLNEDTRLELEIYAPKTYEYIKNLDSFVKLDDED